MLGCSGIAGLYQEVDESVAEAVVIKALRVYGIAALDTAPHYGCGVSEERIGSA